jgi:predicted MFS family arabinose efflux permease
MTTTENHPLSLSGPTERLPLAGLLALAMTGFTCIATETLPAGLLPQIADDLAVSQSLAGQTVTAFAIGSLAAAIPLTVLTHIGTMLAARLVAGAASGLAWALLAGYARRMVVPQLQGRAMAIAMVGTPLALALGVPLGTWLGTAVGWRSTFGIVSVTAVVLVAWICLAVPNFPGQGAQQRIGAGRVLALRRHRVDQWG